MKTPKAPDAKRVSQGVTITHREQASVSVYFLRPKNEGSIQTSPFYWKFKMKAKLFTTIILTFFIKRQGSCYDKI